MQNRKHDSGITSFNPRTPCGVRRTIIENLQWRMKFQSTHSLRSATKAGNVFRGIDHVSIHALLAECDLPPASPSLKRRCFNPRTPCGVRPIVPSKSGNLVGYHSTHSWRSATAYSVPLDRGTHVSIHALLAECDGSVWRIRQEFEKFQSTHSLRSATWTAFLHAVREKVSIHALLAECD